jgi:hypothetical protein
LLSRFRFDIVLLGLFKNYAVSQQLTLRHFWRSHAVGMS